MLNKYLVVVLLFAFAVAQTRSPADQVKPVEKNVVLKLLPRGIDIDDPNDMRNYKKLLELGEVAYPALGQELLESKDPVVASRIISVFVESHGNRREPLRAIKRFITLHGKEESWNAVLLVAVEAIGKIGRSQEVEVLFPLLDSENERLRINSLRSLAMIGDKESALKIRAWRLKRESNASTAAAPKDVSIFEAKQAEEKIRHRFESVGKN